MKTFYEMLVLLENNGFEVKRPDQVDPQEAFIDEFRKVAGQYLQKIKDAGINLYAPEDDHLFFTVDNSRGFNRTFNFNQAREAAEYALTLLKNHLRGQSGVGSGGGFGSGYFG